MSKPNKLEPTGGRMAFGKARALTLAFTEDITHKTTADFTLTVGLEFHL